MKKHLLQIACCILFTASCTQAQNNKNLSPAAFSQSTEGKTNITLLDVRTPEEYNNGHLKNALNIDWSGDTFETQVAELDKKSPVYVYCHSGRRSALAAKKMRDLGFTVYELNGGIVAWDEAKLPKE